MNEIDRRKVYSITPEGLAALDWIIREWYGHANRIAYIFGELIGATYDGLPNQVAGESRANIK